MDKVLIVEDNPVLLKILQAGMKKYENQFVAITARDGEEAIEILGTESISLLVTDLQMPKVDGLTLLAYMNDQHPEIPCVVMSAHGTPQIKEKISRDVLRFIEKPFEIEELVETILPALEGNEPVGTLNGISISNFLQMIHMEQKSCLLEIETGDNRKGYFYFEEGILFDAVYEDLVGEEAALEIIPQERAKIRFKNIAKGKKKVSRRIEKDLMALLMDAMRLKDESDADGESDADWAIEGEKDFPGGDEFTDEQEQTAAEDLDEEFEELDFDNGDLYDASAPSPEEAPPLPGRGAFGTAPPSIESAPNNPLPGISEVLRGMRSVTGFRGAAVLDDSGEVLAQDTVEQGLDMELFAAVVLELIKSTRKVAAEADLGEYRELVLAAERSVLLCVSAGRMPAEALNAVLLLGPDGNRALARIALKKMLPTLEAALA